jgi:hypothetical protein
MADETADFLVKHRYLGSGDLPNVEQFLDECRQEPSSAHPISAIDVERLRNDVV